MKKLIFILSILSFCVGCVSAHQDSNSDEVLVGYRLIDENKADEAIEHFRSLQQKNGENDEYRRGLSSAYALHGGFKIQNLIQPMKEIKAADAVNSDIEVLIVRVLESKPDLVQFKNLILIQLKMLTFLKKFASIPTPTEDQSSDLKLSISTLQHMDSPNQGDFLYMAVLQTLVLKSKLIYDPSVSYDSCDEMVHQYQKKFLNIYSEYGKIISFMSGATPSRKDDYAKQLAQIDSMALETSTLTSASLQALFLIENAKDSDARHIFAEPPRCVQ